MGFRSHHQIGSSPEEASAGFASSGGRSSEHAALVRAMARSPSYRHQSSAPSNRAGGLLRRHARGQLRRGRGFDGPELRFVSVGTREYARFDP